MHIKQVIIEGFKSYREQVISEPFSPKLNAVVGANGSGKTNFFHAIRFVLSDLFHNLRAEDRQALLHEGAGNQVLSAFVEVVFDNADNRIPVDREEVHLRRAIGVKKDEYFLDKKHITKQEVMNLLESAGFSRSNPYYVVQQGKIQSLTVMKDSDRLELLKEIGGTRVYEERRKESLKIMQDTENRRKQIIEVVSYIEERLRELDEEKEELQKYQKLDKKRRAVEYTMFEKEIGDARQRLEEVEEERLAVSQRSNAVHSEVQEAHEQLKDIEKDLKGLGKDTQSVQKEKEVADAHKTEAIEKAAKVELDVKDLEARLQADKKAQSDISKELQHLGKDVGKSEKDMEAVIPEYEAWKEKEEKAQQKVDENAQQLQVLYEKTSALGFQTKAERDKWLRKKVDGLQQPLAQKKKQEATLDKELATLQSSFEEQQRVVAQRSSSQAGPEEELNACLQEMEGLKGQKDTLHNQRKELQRRDHELETQLKRLKESGEKHERQLESHIAKDLNKGLTNTRKLVKQHKISGVHGTLLELIDCEDKFNTCVEVTAGNSLFHVVVDDDDIAARLVQLLNAQRGGRLTFVPLNRVRAQSVQYPTNNPDVVPIMEKLKFDPKFRSAVSQVFSKTLICRDLDVAAVVARSSNLDCVTLEGDQVNKKNVMTGGFHDMRRSRLSVIKRLRQDTKEREVLLKEAVPLKKELAELDMKVTRVLGDIQKLEATRTHLRDRAEQARQEAQLAERQTNSTKKTIAQKEKLLSATRTGIAELERQIARWTADLGTELVGELTAAEQQERQTLQAQEAVLKEELMTCRNKRMEIEARLAQLESLLTTNLVKRQEELRSQLAAIDTASTEDELVSRRRDLEAAQVAVEEAGELQKELATTLRTHSAQIQQLKSRQEELKARMDKLKKSIQNESKDLEKLLNQRNLLQQKREESMKKIRDLGPMPADTAKYKDRPLKELHKVLRKTLEELSKYGHVNKKALDQYVNFTEQREELGKRQAELDKGDEKIRELIDALDRRKEEAIERTFKGVAKNFRESFAELVPGGHGSLVMMKKRRAEDMERDDDDEEDNVDAEGAASKTDKYIGVKVKVSFGQGETQSMKQLSGGQKTVVALALIFAIQRCDPAPFYLFDEIDAALDPQYRTAVASMIKKQADAAVSTQFITTTFRPELVKITDKIYGVSLKNRVSRVDVVSLQEALQFIEQDQSGNQRRQ